MIKNLTDKEFQQKVNKLLIDRKRGIINCGGSIFAVVSTQGVISLTVRVFSKDKDTRVNIGNYPKMSLTEARKKAKQVKQDYKARNHRDNNNSELPTFNEYFNTTWFPEKTAKYKQGSTRPSNLKTLFNKTIIPSGIADYRLDEITPALVCRLMKEVNQTAGNKHNAVSIIIMVCQKAVLEGIIPFNPIANLLSGSESPFPRPRAKGYKFIVPDELGAKFFCPLAKTQKINKCFYLLMSLTGFRFGECRNLKWSYCDFEKKIITIPSDAVGANKTQTDYNKPMTTQIYNLLKSIKIIQNNTWDYVFNSPNGNHPICEASFREPC